MEKQVYTTGQAATLCNVSQQTIIRCFDSGKLQGFRVPGGSARRIPRAELIRFMKENGIPWPRAEQPQWKVEYDNDDGGGGSWFYVGDRIRILNDGYSESHKWLADKIAAFLQSEGIKDE